MDTAAAARRQRLGERAQRYFSDPFDWLEAIPALVIVPLVLTDVLPEWTLIVAAVLSIPVVFRLLVRLAATWEG